MMFEQQFHHVLLTSQRCDMQSCVALLGGIVDNGATLQQLLDYMDVTVLGRQMQSV